jgi:hypothetical protein
MSGTTASRRVSRRWQGGPWRYCTPPWSTNRCAPLPKAHSSGHTSRHWSARQARRLWSPTDDPVGRSCVAVCAITWRRTTRKVRTNDSTSGSRSGCASLTRSRSSSTSLPRALLARPRHIPDPAWGVGAVPRSCSTKVGCQPTTRAHPRPNTGVDQDPAPHRGDAGFVHPRRSPARGGHPKQTAGTRVRPPRLRQGWARAGDTPPELNPHVTAVPTSFA